jgi:hypothetical protein
MIMGFPQPVDHEHERFPKIAHYPMSKRRKHFTDWKNEPYHPKMILQLKGVYLGVPTLKIPECSILSMIKNHHNVECAIVEPLRVRLSRRTNEPVIRGGRMLQGREERHLLTAPTLSAAQLVEARKWV